VVLPDTGADGAATVAESMRAAIADGPVQTAVGPIDVTVSIGSATLGREDAAHLLERADGALYAAKAAGRDRAVRA
jgi:diguanylate cyclase (GGDEF)-like protein